MPEKMLVIDNDELVLKSCRELFEAEGFAVTTAGNSREGLALASAQTFDVVVIEWELSNSGGVDIIEEIGKRSPDSVAVMISAHATVGGATEALKRGAMDYVEKPLKPEVITRAVKEAVRRKIIEEKKAIGRFEKALKSLNLPAPVVDVKPPKAIAETFDQTIGVAKATSPWMTITVLGVLAGAYIGFGGMLSSTVTFETASVLGTGLSRFIGGAVFSVGLMMVIIAGAELFTGNNLMISSALTKKITWSNMFTRWTVVYFANFAGSLLIMVLFFYSGLWKTGDYGLGAAAMNLANNKVTLTFSEVLWRAIGCNWLVCIAVWMACSARQTISKIFAIFFPIMAFVALGFEHCIANMYFIPTGILFSGIPEIASVANIDTSALTWGSFLVNNLVPATIGNIIGGVVFVGMGYWYAYIRPDKK